MANKTSTDIQIKDLGNWKRGQISYFNKSRLQEDAVKAAHNVIFDYDAVVRPRGSFLESGIPDLPTGWKPLGKDFAFKRDDGTEGLLNVFTDGSTANLFVLKADLSGWEQFTGTTFDIAAAISMEEMEGNVVIGNGKDKFTYYNIDTNTVKRFVKVPDPTSTPVITATGFSGTVAFDYYYRVAFNGIGGTTKMTHWVKQTSSTLRDSWSGNRSVAIKIDGFTIDPNAQSWNAYVAMVPTGTGVPTDEEYFAIAQTLPVTQKTFTDDGTATLLTTAAPIENTTEGIVARYFTNISGRLWAIGADDNVYWGGDSGSNLYFGSVNGSDNYNINTGGSVNNANGVSATDNSVEKPMAIVLGRDNAGTTCINILTRTMAGQGAIWDVYATTNSITSNGKTYSVGTYQFKKREGNDGTDAPFSVIHQNNNAYYLSMEGFKSTGVKPNISGIQSTDIISSAIRDRILNLAYSNLNSVYGAYYDEALYWTVAYGSQKNNEIWVYDILHGGIWAIWRFEADSIFRWASTNNESPSLYARQGNKLLRYYKNSRSHSDYNGTFTSYIESGLIPFGDSKLEWVHLLKAVWQFDQAIGQLDITINIHSKNGDIIRTATAPFNETSSSMSVDYGWDAIMAVIGNEHSRGAWDNRSYDETLADVNSVAKPEDKKLDQKIRKNAAYISFNIRSDTQDTYYELSHLSLLFTYIGVGVEFLSQKGVIKI